MTRPDHIEKARNIEERYFLNQTSNLAELIASALAAAEQRGREEAWEWCANLARDLAAERIAFERRRGFSAATATPAANKYWCEEIEAAIRRGQP